MNVVCDNQEVASSRVRGVQSLLDDVLGNLSKGRSEVVVV
jgi:cytochrome c-type biogenesis protein CcmH/NrfF